MTYDWLALASHGLIDLPWWGYVVVALVLTHVTIASVTIFLHRGQAHRALDLHPAISHFFRFWLWLTTGMVTKEWVAIHRKHHAKVETEEDPHSPMTRGIDTVLWQGAELYRAESRNVETLDKYGLGTPDDWIERNVYTRFSWQGVGLMLAVNLVLFGPIGATIWAVQMAWIPFFAAGVINGIGHYWGYRNYAAADTSRNIVPWGILIGGEELHNNHHAYGSSAKFSSRWWELDIGWLYVRTLSALKLATIRKVAPKLQFAKPEARARPRDAAGGDHASLCRRDELRALAQGDLRGRARAPARARASAASSSCADVPSLKRVKQWLSTEPSALPPAERARLAVTLAASRQLQNIYAMREELSVAVVALDRDVRAAARAAAGLVPSRRDVGHRFARALLAAR